MTDQLPSIPTDAAAAGEAPTHDLRVDVHTGALTYVVGSRQVRPNLPATVCPFCPGGLEAPEDYEVRWFPNRWPAMSGGRCEVVLYTPEHDATFWSLGAGGARKVIDLWAERSVALGARDDIAYVLIFENRGAEVGATIAHPHGQIYAFDDVPRQPRSELERGDVFSEPGDRLVATSPGWRAWVPEAPVFPYELVLVPDTRVTDLPSLDDAGRDGLAQLLVDVLERLDRLFDAQTPYMLWIHQRPFDGGDWPEACLHVEIVTPWRAPGVARYIAAGELGSGVFFNPIRPEEAAVALRRAGDSDSTADL
ncbi:MAG: UDPglucose--hexose-phosphate uridylyltransferase [Gaiellaceae bacterium]|nr:UDPglucose--hexose-phosphate uridylyltransferase [Gaiellaceae bacterium]